jgi:translation initiation factor 1
MAPEEQSARVLLETRKGKRQVTVVEGLTAKANDLARILSRLQADCGTGGATKPKEDRIEVQGNHVNQVKKSLKSLGFRLKQ